MPLKAVVGGVEKDAARAEITINGVQKRVTRIEAWNGSAWKVVQAFVLPMSVSASPSGLITTERVQNLELCISYAVTAVPSGGLAPFTYAWTVLSGTFTISTAALAKTTFRATLDYGQSTSGTARCTVTDSLGTQVTVDVSVLLANFG